MKYQNTINLLNDTPKQPPKFITKNWVERNDVSRKMYNINSQLKFKTSMLKSSLCDYSDAYIIVKGKIIVSVAEADNAAKDADRNDNKAIFKNCAPLTDCITETNNTQVDNANDVAWTM